MFCKESRSLRVFHNKIKSMLIDKCARNEELLIDIGVGRGGDMYKWSKSNIRKVIGYDIDQDAIDDANKRYVTCQIDKALYDYEFVRYPNLDAFIETLPNINVKVVSCQFAIHYFFRDEAHVNSLFQFLSQKIVNHGFFFGTFMCGNRLEELTNGFKSPFENTSFLVNPGEYDRNKDYGNQVDVHLTNTLYFGESSVSVEYVVFKHVLQSKAEEYGFKLVEFKDFEDYYDETTNLRRNTIALSNANKLCSFAYSSFIFKKKSS